MSTGAPAPIEWVRRVTTRLPRYMVPSTVHVVNEIPYTSTGKADRRSLVARHVAGRRP